MDSRKHSNFLNFFEKDRRFLDPLWQDNPLFQKLKDCYLTYQDLIISMIEETDIPFEEKQKISFWMKMLLDAFSPSNFPLTNPEVLRETARQKGNNFVRGIQNFWKDMANNPGFFPPLTNMSAFKLGENIANTPGSIVFQNDVFQLIQYNPIIPDTHESPLLLIPAWINKYYFFDLSEQKSFVRFNLEQGRTVFCISWINPTSAQHKLTFRDYLDHGIEEAIQQAYQINQRQIPASSNDQGKINTVAICVGGTFLLTKLAEQAEKNKQLPIRSMTLLMVPFDFSNLEWSHFFISEPWLESIRKQLELPPETTHSYGILAGEMMMRMFCCLRANDLIWPNYVERYLLGKELSAIDFLYWNHDVPRIPIRMLCEYVEHFFFQNSFIKNRSVEAEKAFPQVEWATHLQNGLEKLDIPAFIFGTERDHLVPWESCYKAFQTIQNSKFVLGGAGHVVGCINPPSSHKYHYWEQEDENANTSPEKKKEISKIAWLEEANKKEGSWWPTWSHWLQSFDGSEIQAFGPESIIEPAPGRYAK